MTAVCDSQHMFVDDQHFAEWSCFCTPAMRKGLNISAVHCGDIMPGAGVVCFNSLYGGLTYACLHLLV